MGQESSQKSNNFAQVVDHGVGEIIIKHNGTIVSEVTQIQSTPTLSAATIASQGANVEVSNNLGELSESNQ